METLGHSQIAVTANIYAHVGETDQTGDGSDDGRRAFDGNVEGVREGFAQWPKGSISLPTTPIARPNGVIAGRCRPRMGMASAWRKTSHAPSATRT